MRALVASVVALGLAVSPALANNAAPGDKDPGAATTAPAATAQPANASASAEKAAPSSMEVATQLEQMRELLESQSRQLAEQQQRMQLLEEQLKAATAGGASLAANPNASSSATTAALASNAGLGGSADDKAGPPTSITFKGITLTPGGFMVAESVWRQHALSADVNTPFNGIPFEGASNAHTTEFNASGRQSRISMLVEGKLNNVKIGGYYETDFLSAGVTSNYNQSNSFTLRQRQFWGQAAFTNGITVTGGQMWSLVTETKKGMDNRTEAAPLTIDAQYQVGFSWLRQYGLRVTKNFDNKVWLGFAVENGETTTAFHGQNNNFVVGAPGNGGGLLNAVANFAYTKAPDFVFKAAFEPGFGHYEIFGIVSTFRDRVYPCVGATPAAPCELNGSPFPGSGAFNDSRVGGGVGANARITVFKKADLGIHFLGGDGVGRYGTSSLADVTVRPDGTLAPIRSFQSLGTIELHPTSKLDIYLYGGGEFAARTQFNQNEETGLFSTGYGATGLANFGCNIEQTPGSPVSTPTGVGGAAGFVPGSPASCTGDTRAIYEGTVGFWYRFYKGPKGTVQFGPQYSYVQRTAWRGVGSGTVNGNPVETNGGPSAHENMVFTSFRYYLP